MTVPKLRFKEFINDWKITSLGSEIGISSASRVLKEQWRASGVPFFRTSDVISIFKSEENQKVFISYDLFETLSNKSGRIKKGDLLITGGGSIGIPYLKKDNSPLYFKDADLLWLKSSEKINGEFLYNFFQSQSFKVYLKSISHTGTISHFTIEQAKTTPINLPSKEEQTKIANFLTTVDKKISQLNEQHQLMIQYKKGVMQKIFSQEIRFKDDNGEDFGEWKEKKLSEIAYITTGSSNREDSHEKNGMYTFFDRSEDIRTSNKYLFDSEALIIGGEGSIFKPKYFVGKFDLHQRAYAIMEFKNTVAKYLFYFIEFNHLYFLSVAVGTTVKSLRLPMFENMPVKLPSVDEQFKIADFLTAIDKRIENLAQQLEQAKIWKKGLLQQMFV